MTSASTSRATSRNLFRCSKGKQAVWATLLATLILALCPAPFAFGQPSRTQRITLSATQEKNAAVKLNWAIENLTKSEAVRIFRATNLGAFQIFSGYQLLRSVDPLTTEYVDNTALAGVGYRYYVDTFNALTLASPLSNIVEINPVPAPTAGIFVSPTGLATNTGAANSPLDLATSLSANTATRANTTIWLRGGLYNLAGAILSGTEAPPFRATLNGQPGAPITIRSYPGEWAIINGGIRVDGNDLIFRDLEITNTNANRELPRPTGIAVYGKRVKLINLVIHDTGNAMGLWNVAEETEAYGNVLYRNGWEGPKDVRGNGHGMYIQNRIGTKFIRDNISLDNYATGMKAYGEATAISGVTFDGNISYNNGSPARPRPDNDRLDNMFVGSPLGAEKIVWTNNFTYHPLTARGTSVRLGYVANNNKDATLRDNYFVGGVTALAYFFRWESITMTGNTLVADRELIALNAPTVQSTMAYQWNQNRYFARDAQRAFTYGVSGGGQGYNFRDWAATTTLDANSQLLSSNNGRLTGTHVAIRKNQYEAGRANLAVFNWDLHTSITLTAAQLAGILRPGDGFVIQNAQAMKGTPVASGTFDGTSILLPLRGGTLGLEFNAFVLLRTHSSAASAPAADETDSVSLGSSTNQITVNDSQHASSIDAQGENSELVLSEEAQRVIQKLNEFRLAQNLTPLNVNANLCQASEWSARDMAQREEAGAVDSLGRNAMQRARDFGFPGTLAPVDESEWVLATNGNEHEIIERLTSSASDHGLSTLPAWKSVGIARALNPTTGRWYWSVIFGAC